MRACRCCVPGCGAVLALMPFVTIDPILDLTEAICRACLRRVAPAARAVLCQARLELRLSPCIDEFILFFRAWEAVKHLAIERAGRRMAA